MSKYCSDCGLTTLSTRARTCSECKSKELIKAKDVIDFKYNFGRITGTVTSIEEGGLKVNSDYGIHTLTKNDEPMKV